MTDTPHHLDLPSLFIPRSTIAAFVSDAQLRADLTELAGAQLLSRADISINDGSLEEAIRHFPIGRTPNVLIIEYDGEPDELDRLAEICAETTNVIIIGRTNDVPRYRKFLAKGVTDYLFTPLSQGLLIAAIAKATTAQLDSAAGQIITFLGASGGVGSSTMAQSVALQLAAEPEKRVMLIDLDVHMGTVALNFDLKTVRDPSELFDPDKQVTMGQIDQFLRSRGTDLKLLVARPSLTEAPRLAVDPVMALLEQARLMADYVVLDMPSNWSDIHARLLAVSDRVIVTARPTLTSYQGVHNIFRLAARSRQSLPSPRLVLNAPGGKSDLHMGPEMFAKSALPDPVIEIGDHTKILALAAQQGKMPAEIRSGDSFLAALAPVVQAALGKSPVAAKKEQKKRGFAGIFTRAQA